MPILVREIELRHGETLEELEERIHTVEHVAIVKGTRIILKERRRRNEGSKKPV